MLGYSDCIQCIHHFLKIIGLGNIYAYIGPIILLIVIFKSFAFFRVYIVCNLVFRREDMQNYSEREVEHRLVQGVQQGGGLCLKWVSPGRRGVPDRVALWPGGQVDFIELKRRGGRLSALQRKTIKEIEDLGFPCYVLYGMDAVEGYLNDRRRDEVHTS